MNVVEVPKHDFKGDLKEARAEAKQWAIENYQGKEFSLPDNGGVYAIGKKAFNKYVDKTAIDKSDNAMIHLSALKELPNIINSSITAEIHPDYKKGDNNKRSIANGVNNEGLLVHRMYGVIKIDDKTYRVKTTMNEFIDPLATNTPHSYEVTEIELIESPSTPSSKDDRKPLDVSNNSISATKILDKVEKSYDKGKYLLDESEKPIRFRKSSNLKESLGNEYDGTMTSIYDSMTEEDKKAYGNNPGRSREESIVNICCKTYCIRCIYAIKHIKILVYEQKVVIKLGR